MAVRTTTLSLENLESRLNLSTLAGQLFPLAASTHTHTQERAVMRGSSRMISMAKAAGNMHSMVKSPLIAAGSSLSAAPDLAASATTKVITLTWLNNSSNATGFHIERSTDGGETFSVIASVNVKKSTFVDKKVSAGVTYTYRVTAYNKNPGSTASGTVSIALETPSAPTLPTQLAESKASLTSISLSWRDNATNETGYHVYRSTDGDNYTLVGNVKANGRSFTDRQVTQGMTYDYKVAAWNVGGETFTESPATATTLMPPPKAPANITTSDLTGSGVTLSWTESVMGVSGYRIYRSTNGKNYTLVGNVGGATTSFSDSDLAGTTKYYYEVSAWNAQKTVTSKAVSVTTLAAAPNFPSSLAFTDVTSDAVTLNWNDNATNETGFMVYRSSDGLTYSQVGATGVNQTTFEDGSLDAGSTYWYRVTAYNDGGESAATGGEIATRSNPSPDAQAPTAAPAIPGNLLVSDVTTSAATLNWSAPGSQTGYHIYRSTDGTNYALVGTLAANATSWSDSNLNSGTSYSYEVGAYNVGGESRTSAATITTAAPLQVTTPPVTGNPVTITTQNMTSFNELVITGTSGNDSILVSQSNGKLIITANGQTSIYANTYGDLKIYGISGSDTITVDSSVNIASLVYAGDGSDVIRNLTTSKATIVTIGDGVSTVTGNGVNTAYWVNTGDTVNATSAEISLGGVNRVANFYQPFTTTTSSSNYIPRTLNGQNLPDPTDSGAEKRLTNSSLWGTGPAMNDINQTGLADCYYLAPLASLAYSEPQRLMNMGVDLGDGTYAVRFVRNGTTSYVRVDGDLSTGYWGYGLANQTPGASGNEWGSIFEKAYAYFRSSSNTYASLNYGSQSMTYSDLGLANRAASPSSTSASSTLSLINTQLAAGHGMAASTISAIKAGAPLIGSHVYTVVGAYQNSSGTVMVQLRNPWGVDGAGNDGNTSDALVTIDYATFIANFNSLNYTTV